MIVQLEMFLRNLRRWFSRSEWVAYLLKLKKCDDPSPLPGLILVQVDGLSGLQFQKAVQRGNLPFLHRLMEQERYVFHSVYSGLPSNTPAAQAELFYGVKRAVPSFSFFDEKTNRIFRMYEPFAASEIEKRLVEKGAAGLLQEGSCYSDIFTGGAAQAHSASTGWLPFLRQTNPFLLGFIVLLYLDIILRTAALLVLEILLALFDLVRGTLAGRSFFVELRFVPSRVAICILLRELVVAAVQMDLARGLPVIHLNFVGYDEQAHHRGPSSQFAHWSLKGIDYSIQRIWEAASRSSRRAYEIWIYSDHGQEYTLPYNLKYGQTIENVVADFFGEPCYSAPKKIGRGVQAKRTNLLFRKFAELNLGHDGLVQGSKFILTAMGPIGNLYLKTDLTPEQKLKLARELIAKTNIPLVLIPAEKDKAYAVTDSRILNLPEQTHELFSRKHPFLEELAKDLTGLCHNPQSGTFIVSGWKKGHTTITFPIENGSHGGFGPEETSAFALLPLDAPLPSHYSDYLRHTDLREAAQKVLSGSASLNLVARLKRADTFRIMTYNVHGCVGTDGRLAPDRVARVIARQGADIITLQELDVFRKRSGQVNQAEVIARKLEMNFHFHPTFHHEDGQYGIATLSRFPMRVLKIGSLPRSARRPKLETRGVVWMEIKINGSTLHLLSTHLSVWPHERLLQSRHLASADWLAHPHCKGPVVFCGDLNALPGSQAYRAVAARLQDVQLFSARHPPLNTWHGRYPFSRIDHIFVSDELEVENVKVPQTELEKTASDHLPLVADLKICSVTEHSKKIYSESMATK